MRTIAFIFAVLFGSAQSLFAENVEEIFGKVNEYIEGENYTKALSELAWAKKEIEKMHLKHLESFFPDSLASYSGGKFTPNTAMGITNIERSYSNGSAKVNVSLTGGSSGGGGAFGNLAGIGRMAAMFQGQTPGQDTFRIDGRTASLNTKNEKRPELTVFLENGALLNIKTASGEVKADDLKEMAKAVKLEELDSYLKG